MSSQGFLHYNNRYEEITIMNIYDLILKWYSQQGISTEHFFADNSTEIGRDEMLLDFAYRMLKKEGALNAIE